MDTGEKFAIHELLARAAAALDAHDLDTLFACFTDDIVFTIDITGQGEVGPFDGKDAVKGLIGGAVEVQTDKRRHVISNMYFTEEGAERAVISSNLTLFGTENGEVNLICTGVYTDIVVKNGGHWQISNRHLILDRPY